MKIDDIVYGKIEIDDPDALEIINCPDFQRLKSINQWGYTKHLYKINVTRYEHSIGVYYLLNKYGASKAEQLAGLIHDISHTAFSHVADYLFRDVEGGATLSHQDENHRLFISTSSLPTILKKHGFSWKKLSDIENFKLLDTNLPDLCADRIDYLLRDSIALNEIDVNCANEFLDRLSVKNNQWVFQNQHIAEKFSQLFQMINQKYYSDFNRAAVMYHCLRKYLRYALDEKYIQESDLLKDDRYVLDKLVLHHKTDPKMITLFKRLNDKNSYTNDPNNYEAIVKCKSRAVDPLFLDKDKIKHLSDKFPRWKSAVKKELVPKIFYLKPNF